MGKMKSSLHLNMHHTIKTYREWRSTFIFLNSELEGAECSASFPSQFISCESVPSINWMGW
jgi:hypothetical protein